MNPRLLTTPRAARDILEIGSHIAQDSGRAADRLLRSIDAKLKLLARSPKLGRRREELAPDLRSFPVAPYVVFYRHIHGGVQIIRVLHGARDITAEFD